MLCELRLIPAKAKDSLLSYRNIKLLSLSSFRTDVQPNDDKSEDPEDNTTEFHVHRNKYLAECDGKLQFIYEADLEIQIEKGCYELVSKALIPNRLKTILDKMATIDHNDDNEHQKLHFNLAKESMSLVPDKWKELLRRTVDANLLMVRQNDKVHLHPDVDFSEHGIFLDVVDQDSSEPEDFGAGAELIRILDKLAAMEASYDAQCGTNMHPDYDDVAEYRNRVWELVPKSFMTLLKRLFGANMFDVVQSAGGCHLSFEIDGDLAPHPECSNSYTIKIGSEYGSRSGDIQKLFQEIVGTGYKVTMELSEIGKKAEAESAKREKEYELEQQEKFVKEGQEIIVIDYPETFRFRTKAELPEFDDNEGCDVRCRELLKAMKAQKINSPCHAYEDYAVSTVTKLQYGERWTLDS